MLTYSVYMLLQLINRLVPERRRLFVDEEGVYDGTSTDVSGSRAWVSEANKRLNSLYYTLDVFLGAVWSVDILHNYDPMVQAMVQAVVGTEKAS